MTQATTSPAPRRRSWVRSEWFGPLVIIVLIVVANGVYLFGFTTPNPLGTRGWTVTSAPKGYLPGERTIDPNNGFINQAIGKAVARQITSGEMPTWDSNQGAGMPLLASSQSAALFPPTVLNGLPNGLFYESMLLECIGGLSTYFLVRRLRFSRGAAAFAGVAFALNGTFSWLQNGSMLPVAFIPLLLLGVERAMARAEEGRPGGWAIIAVATGLLIQSGFVETVYIAGFLVAAWTLWRLAAAPRARRRSAVGKTCAGVVAGGLLGAPLLLPFVNYLGVADLGGHAGDLARATYPVQALPTLLGLPYAYGPIAALDNSSGQIGAVWARVGGYASAAIIVLALIGLVGRGRRGLRIVLGVWVAFCLAKSFGPQIVLTVVNHVPGMSSAAFYRYMDPSLELALVILAALGLDRLIRRTVDRRDLVIAAVAAGSLFWIAEQIARPVTAGVPDAARALNYSFGWALAVLVAIVVVAQITHDGARAWAVAVVGIADVVLTFAVPSLSAPKSMEVHTETATWLRGHVGLQRASSFGTINPNYGTYFDVPIAQSTNVPLPKRWTAYLRRHYGQGVDPFNFAFDGASQNAALAHPEVLADLGVRYVIATRGATLPASMADRLTLVHRNALSDIYRLSGTKPYFSVVAADCTVSGRSRTSAIVRCDRPSSFVRRELYYPGWSATVNGRSVPITATDGIFQRIALPAGTSRVTFDYDAPHLTVGLVGAAVGGLWIIGGLIDPEWVRRFRARSSAKLDLPEIEDHRGGLVEHSKSR